MSAPPSADSGAWSAEDDFSSASAKEWSNLVPDADLDVDLTAMATRFQRGARVLAAANNKQLKHFAGSGITGVADYDTIILLRRSGPAGLQVREISESLRMTRGAVSNRIDRLERDGLIDRTSNPRDRRSHFVALTPKGADLAERMYTAIHAVNASFFGGLTGSQVRQLAELLSIVRGTRTEA